MSIEKKQAKELDDALRGNGVSGETDPLKETAETVSRSLAVDVPPADRQRALFIAGVGGRDRTRRVPVARLLVPAMAVLVLLFAAMAARRALPGEELYPFRQALNVVGLARTPVDAVDDHLSDSARLLRDADDTLVTNPDRARSLAIKALQELGQARELLPELGNQREATLERVEDFEEQAIELIEEAAETEEELLEEREDAQEDRSGSGEGSDDDDNSGPGSDDSSGSGSGSDDNSGPGSDDSSGSGSGDDSSGSGSGSDDSSGSGSGSGDSSGSGSGSDDSSGSGSGDDRDELEVDDADNSGRGSD